MTSSTVGNVRSGKISPALEIITFTTFWKIPRSGEIPILVSGHIPGPNTMARLTAPILLTLEFLWTLVKGLVRIYHYCGCWLTRRNGYTRVVGNSIDTVEDGPLHHEIAVSSDRRRVQ